VNQEGRIDKRMLIERLGQDERLYIDDKYQNFSTKIKALE
jgi:hypothetical protein